MDYDFDPSGPTACEASKYKEIIYYPLDIKSIYLLQNETSLILLQKPGLDMQNMSYKLQNATVHKIILSDSQWNNTYK